MGARSNKTFKQKPKISKASAAKKFKKKANPLKGVTYIDYKDVALLRRFISDRGKIRSSRITGVTVQQQRMISRAIKNAREMGLLPYSSSAR